MGRLFFTLLSIASLCFGTSAIHLACACCTDAPLSRAGGNERHPIGHQAGCCSTPAAPAPDRPAAPCDIDPEHCPCLYWNSLPLATPDAPPGAALLKRTIAATPFLLLEAAPLSLRHVAAVTPRDGPPGPRDNGTRLQAWTCVWTI